MIYSLLANKKVKHFQILSGDAEYFGLLLIKSSDSQNFFLLQYTMKSPISVSHQWFHSFEIGCKYNF